MFYKDYLKGNSIEPLKDGVKAYITSEQKQELDRYHQHRLNGTISTVSRHLETTSDIALNSTAMILINAVANRLNPPTADPLAIQEQLQRISDRQWTVSTSQLRQIIGRKPKVGNLYGFEFSKAGKISFQDAWRIRQGNKQSEFE